MFLSVGAWERVLLTVSSRRPGRPAPWQSVSAILASMPGSTIWPSRPGNRRRADFEEENERVHQREEARKQAIEAIAPPRRLHLLDAAGGVSSNRSHHAGSRPDLSEEERCRQVLIWVRLELTDRREEKGARPEPPAKRSTRFTSTHECSRDVLGRADGVRSWAGETPPLPSCRRCRGEVSVTA